MHLAGKSRLTILEIVKRSSKCHINDLNEFYNETLKESSFVHDQQVLTIETKNMLERIREVALKNTWNEEEQRWVKPSAANLEIARKVTLDIERIFSDKNIEESDLEFEFNYLNASDPKLLLLITTANDYKKGFIDITEYNKVLDLYFES